MRKLCQCWSSVVIDGKRLKSSCAAVLTSTSNRFAKLHGPGSQAFHSSIRAHLQNRTHLYGRVEAMHSFTYLRHDEMPGNPSVTGHHNGLGYQLSMESAQGTHDRKNRGPACSSPSTDTFDTLLVYFVGLESRPSQKRTRTKSTRMPQTADHFERSNPPDPGLTADQEGDSTGCYQYSVHINHGPFGKGR
jgi:hypothetical protein